MPHFGSSLHQSKFVKINMDREQDQYGGTCHCVPVPVFCRFDRGFSGADRRICCSAAWMIFASIVAKAACSAEGKRYCNVTWVLKLAFAAEG